MKKLIPIILVLIGIGGGIGAGLALRPAPPEKAASDCADPDNCDDKPPTLAAVAAIEDVDPDVVNEFAKLSKQFVVPIVRNDRVRALIVMSITIEVEAGGVDGILAREPKIRDTFLQVLFEHAQSGGFDGSFTTGQAMRDLRGSLKEVARKYAGDVVKGVLITELVKQAI
jgi:hypothetical protein